MNSVQIGQKSYEMPRRDGFNVETLCYIRDPDGYSIEVGQSNPDFTSG